MPLMSNNEPIQRRCRGAFTLVEVLLVITIIGVLIGLLLPAVQMGREAARRMSCADHLRQLALAAHKYHDTALRFPTGLRVADRMSDGRLANGTNWVVEMLPHLEQQSLYEKWDFADHRNNVAGERNALTAQVIAVLLCPSDLLPDPVATYAGSVAAAHGLYGETSYGGNAGKRSFPAGPAPAYANLTRDGLFCIDSIVRIADITDGTSHTFLFGERSHHDPEFNRTSDYPLTDWGLWGHVADPTALSDIMLSSRVPINYRVPTSTPVGDNSSHQDRLCAFGSGHPGGANFAFADGSVRFVGAEISLATLQALSTRAGQEIGTTP
jgi:prepilin-type processing-associated H-X9-DG protein/prepilin-type N-terminal cleavage/methylation domain-containing protein